MSATVRARGREREPGKLRGIVFEQEGSFVVVCLDRYLMTVAESKDQVRRAIERMIVGHIVISLENGKTPFVDLPQAPEKYWEMYDSLRPAEEDLVPTPPEGLFQQFPSLNFRAGLTPAYG